MKPKTKSEALSAGYVEIGNYGMAEGNDLIVCLPGDSEEVLSVYETLYYPDETTEVDVKRLEVNGAVWVDEWA